MRKEYQMKTVVINLSLLISLTSLGAEQVPNMTLTMGSGVCVVFNDSEVEIYRKDLWVQKIYGPTPVRYEINPWGGLHISSADGHFDYRDLRPGSPSGPNEIVLSHTEEGTLIYGWLEKNTKCPFSTTNAHVAY
jgi:hypothetical protein